MTKAVELAQVASTGVSEAFKNRIINGAMTISQYNGTSSVTPTTDTYVIDRFKAVRSQNNLSFQQNAGSVTPPAGFTNYLGITATTGATIGGPDYWYLAQFIEGFNTADLNWGTANAKTVTLSFWVRASVTGSYSVGFHNNAEDRAYLTTYTISAANTWEYKTITLTGDTTGTWVGAGNGKGIGIFFNLGVGSVFGTSTTNSWIAGWNPGLTTGVQFAANAGATFYITGVQLEVGTSATNFEYRAYGTELALCQRYYQAWYPAEQELIYNESNGSVNKFWQLYMPVPMRTAPTATYSAGMTGGAVVGLPGTISALSLTSSSVNRLSTRVTMSTSGGSSNLMYHCDTIGGGDFVGLSAEL